MPSFNDLAARENHSTPLQVWLIRPLSQQQLGVKGTQADGKSLQSCDLGWIVVHDVCAPIHFPKLQSSSLAFIMLVRSCHPSGMLVKDCFAWLRGARAFFSKHSYTAVHACNAAINEMQ